MNTSFKREMIAAIVDEQQQLGRRDPYKAYLSHKSGARRRKIGWEFDFFGWWLIWKDYFHMRGRGTNDLCMARHGDVGPYSPTNVYLTTHLGNSLDHWSSETGINKRQRKKEDRERRRFWNPSVAKADVSGKVSMAMNRATHGPHSTCNYTEDVPE